MHIKAIQIKEQLLGHEDYEVALSVGHLASLYNYDMNQYEDAERLYLRSIAIGQSGLAPCFSVIVGKVLEISWKANNVIRVFNTEIAVEFGLFPDEQVGFCLFSHR